MIYKDYFKRLLDILGSVIGMPVFLLSFVIVAPAIYYEDKGPIFYLADRRGINGKPFKMFKYRSMIVNAPDIRNKDNSTFNAADDFRVTNIGRILRKTSIDELPQLINVLKGEMSFIGPRPITIVDSMDNYSDNMLDMLKVRPGITGYTQAYFRNSIDQEKKFEYDADYARKVTFLKDVKIFLKTIQTVISRKNVYIKEVDDKDLHVL